MCDTDNVPSLTEQKRPTKKQIMKHIATQIGRSNLQKDIDFLNNLEPVAKHLSVLAKKFYYRGSTKMTEEVCLEILNRLCRGEQLSSICQDSHLPAFGTVQKWIRIDPDFQEAYKEAMTFQMNKFADEILEIADRKGRENYKPNDYGEEELVKDSKVGVERDTLRIQTRKWLMERFHRQMYSLELKKESDYVPASTGTVKIQINIPDNGRSIESTVVDV